MGSGSSSNSSKPSPQGQGQRQSNLPDHVLEMLQESLLSLPFPPGDIDERTIDSAAQNAERLELLEPQVILTKGQKAKGIYIVISGEAQVVSSSGIIIASLFSGSLFGEVSTLYQIPCTATIKVPSKVLLLFIKSAAIKTLLKGKVMSGNLMDYFVQKRYLDTSDAVNQLELMHQIAKALLHEIPLFKNWGDNAVESLVQAVESDGPVVTLAPPQSIIAMTGDPADEIVIILKGRVEVLNQKEVLSKLDSSRWPVWLGEEAVYEWYEGLNDKAIESHGLFTGRHSLVLVKTITACQMIFIKNSLINEVVKKFKTEAATDFTKRLDKWRKKMAGTDPKKSLDAYYRLEVLIQRLSETTLLWDVPLEPLYKLSVGSRTLAYKAGDDIAGDGTPERKQSKMVISEGRQNASKPDPSTKIDPSLPPDTQIEASASSQVFWADDTFVLVLKGEMQLNDNGEWTTKDDEVLWMPRVVYPNSRLKAKTDCIILLFTGSALDEACSDYPDVILTIPSTVR